MLSAKHQMLFLRISVSLQANECEEEFGGEEAQKSLWRLLPRKEGQSTALGSKCKLVAFRHFLFCRLAGGGGRGGGTKEWGEGKPEREFK